MTISYNLDVSSSKSYTFLKLIFRWRGSIWKSCFSEMFWWLAGYYVIFGVMRLFSRPDRINLLNMAKSIDNQLTWIPLEFMLGFFVNIVVDRWKQIFHSMSFIDNPALRLAVYSDNDGAKERILRRNVVRYLCLSQVLVLRDIAVSVRKRFPTHESIVDAGFMNVEEQQLLDSHGAGYSPFWMPIHWAYSLVRELRRRESFPNDLFCHAVIEEIRTYRSNLQQMLNYDWVPVPLAYTQVVFLAVRVYFLICLMSRQYTTVPDLTDEWYIVIQNIVPLITCIQFFFCMGWLKVAEALLNPLGEDDDDFETNFIIDRNLTIGMAIVDDCRGIFPRQTRDKFGKDEQPLDSTVTREGGHALIGSASQLIIESEVERKNSAAQVQNGLKSLRDQVQRRFSRSAVRPSEDVESGDGRFTEEDLKRLQQLHAINLETLKEEEESICSSEEEYADGYPRVEGHKRK